MPISKPIDFNLFSFATGELSHSAFWAWVLQTLCPDCPRSLEAVQPLAKSLLRRIGAAGIDLAEVKTEYSVKASPNAGRMDIVAFGKERDVVIIEHKVDAVPYLPQIERYGQAMEPEYAVRAAVILS
ncbi:MAG: PD-(D/E)XK nuclease family protein, partial [Gemmatimonadaceae bacterium]